MKSVSEKKMPRQGINKILIRGTNWIGDAVMTLPAVEAIRATYPRAHIAMLVKPWVADVYRLFSPLDEIILYENKFDNPAGVFGLSRLIREKKFDAAILLQNAIEAAIIALSAGIPLRAGYDSDARGLLLTHRVRRTREIRQVHQIDYYLEMVKSLGCVPVAREMHLETKLNMTDARAVLAKYQLSTDQTIIGMAPGATYGAAKKWFPERFAEVADTLGKRNSARLIIIGGRGDDQAAQEVQKSSRTEIMNLAGKTNLHDAIYLISQCRLFISNDSGLMHVAGALNVPTVAVFGSTNPVTTAPAGERSVIVRHDVSCSPCLKKTCPSDFRCMKLVSVKDVLQAAQSLLEK